MDFEKLKKSIDSLKEAVETQNKALHDFETENDKRLKEIEAKGGADPLLTDKVEKIATEIADLETIKQQIDSIERAIALAQLPGGDGDEKPIYNNIGEQLIDVFTMADPNPSPSKKAEAADRLTKVQAAASGANETVGHEGGYLVSTDKATMLDRGVIATGLLSQRCFNVPCSADSDSLELTLLDESSRANGSRFGGIQVYMKSEAATVTATKPKFRPAEWKLKDCMGLMYATNDLLRDASALTAVVNRWFPMEFGFKIDDLIINGTGAGMPIGVLNAGCLVSCSVATGQGTRASNTNKVIYDNIVQMYSQLLSSSDPNANWYVNRELLPSIMMMTIPVGTGGAPVFLPPNGAAGMPYMTLLNKPIIPIEQCQAPGTVGDIILGDLGEYLLFTKGGIEASASIHVRFIYDEMTFKWVYRLDGAPLRNKALTPYSGSNDLSPFVALAAS